MTSAALADVVLIIHALFVLFVVGGQVTILIGWLGGWAWTRRVLFRAAHLVAIGVVVAKAWLGTPCVLTVLESALRERAGGEAYGGTFIAYWVGRLLFYEAPPWVFTLAYSVFGAVTLATWWGYPPQSRDSARTRRQVQ